VFNRIIKNGQYHHFGDMYSMES